MGKIKTYYAVNKGKSTGIYYTWAECEKQVKGYSGAKYKKFDSLAEAKAFIGSGLYNLKKKSIKKIGADEIKTKTKSIDLKGIVDPKKIKTEDMPDGTTVVYTDGASRGNGREGAYAGYGVWFGHDDKRNFYAKLEGEKQTNQRAEVMAGIKALEIIGPDTSVEIRTDSQYLIKAITTWIHKWSKNNWISGNGKAVENSDLFKTLHKMVSERKAPIKWTHVRGHVGIEGNEMADKLANKGADLHNS